MSGETLKYGFGDKVKDRVTNYVGYITAVCIYDSGEIQYRVEGMDTTGRPIADWIDEYRLEEVSE